jgi:hypothetical protein
MCKTSNPAHCLRPSLHAFTVPGAPSSSVKVGLSHQEDPAPTVLASHFPKTRLAQIFFRVTISTIESDSVRYS